MVVTVFRSRVQPEYADEFGELAAKMRAIVEEMPGFLSYKLYTADDGERCSVIEFESAEHLQAWRTHPDHVAAIQTGRDRYYAEYTSVVADPIRESRFER